MRPALHLYHAAQRLVRLATPALAPLGGKVGRGLAARRTAHEELVRRSGAVRDPARPLVWFHAPSVGEGLQARAVMEALAARRPDVQMAFTHFSPSAEGLAGRVPAEVVGYLPWDLPGPMDRVLDALRPDVLVFTKTEVWPELTRRARARQIPVALVAATLPEAAGRRGPLARWFLGPTWSELSLVAAIAAEDGHRFQELGVPPWAVEVAGDPGIDSAAQRAGAADPDAPWLAPFHAAPRPTLVAGSTWPADEEVLLPAVDAVRRDRDDLRVVVAPHEPDEAHVAGLVRAFQALGWNAATLASVESGGADGVDAVVVDRVGVLAALYTVGSVAYVGGGFHDQGLHSVLEPAAARLPVLFGPRHGNARAAGELAGVGGAAVVGSSEELAAMLSRWCDDGRARDYAASRAYDYIDRHRGAADRTAELLAARLPDLPPAHRP